MMNSENEKAFKALVGEHTLQAVAYGQDGNGLFRLDNVTFEAVCDEDDGYRSYMDQLKVVDTIPKMYDIPVLVSYENDFDDTRVELRDRRNGKLILNVGTRDVTDYYPCYVFNYIPENIFENEGK